MNKEESIDIIRKSFTESLQVKQSLLDDGKLQEKIAEVASVIAQAIKSGHKLLVCGNGGSAADAQHIAGEFVNRFYYDRPPMACIALSTDTSVMTAISNDYSYEDIFAKQVDAFGNCADIFLGISTSGNSKNIVKAMRLCKEKGIVTIALIGGDEHAAMLKWADHGITIKSKTTPRIQEAHELIYHVISQLVEAEIYPKK